MYGGSVNVAVDVLTLGLLGKDDRHIEMSRLMNHYAAQNRE